MSEQHLCDDCGDVIEQGGYTVEWTPGMPEGGVVRTVENRGQAHFCDECWPDEIESENTHHKLLGRLR
jgi:hypothetical protein